MEALTIRQLYERKVCEDGQKRYKQEFRLRQKAEIKHKEAEKLRQEEARMRQEEARMRQEKLAISVLKLYSQGFSPESIADVLLEPLEIIQGIISSTPSV